MRPDALDPSDDAKDGSRSQRFNLSPTEGTNFDLSHRHSGIHGDGQKVKAASLDTSSAFPTGEEPIYLPVNAPTSGRQYRIQIVEVTDPDTSQITPVIQVIPA